MAGPVIVYDARPVVDALGRFFGRFISPFILIVGVTFGLVETGGFFWWLLVKVPMDVLTNTYPPSPPHVRSWLEVFGVGFFLLTWLVPMAVALYRLPQVGGSREGGMLRAVRGFISGLFLFTGWSRWGMANDPVVMEVSPFEWIFRARLPIYFTLFYQVVQWLFWFSVVGVAAIVVNAVIWVPVVWLLDVFDLWPALAHLIELLVEIVAGKTAAAPLDKDLLILSVILVPLAPKIFLISHKLFSIQMGWAIEQLEDRSAWRYITWPIML